MVLLQSSFFNAASLQQLLQHDTSSTRHRFNTASLQYSTSSIWYLFNMVLLQYDTSSMWRFFRVALFQHGSSSTRYRFKKRLSNCWRNFEYFAYSVIINDTMLKWMLQLDSMCLKDAKILPRSSDCRWWWSLRGVKFIERNFGTFLPTAPHTSVLWSNGWYHSIQCIR